MTAPIDCGGCPRDGSQYSVATVMDGLSLFPLQLWVTVSDR